MSGERWYQEKKSEHFYKQAKKQGYRARSAYKLLQINRKFHILKKGNVVVDLGCAPGGWSQVAQEITGEGGVVVGIDLLPIEPLKGVKFLRGDMTDDATVMRLFDVVKEKTQENARLSYHVDTVISDMSPNICGSYSTDQARSVWLCMRALEFAQKVLKKGGNFTCKIFEGEDYIEFRTELKRHFNIVKPYSPPASRNASSEIYLIAKGFKGEIAEAKQTPDMEGNAAEHPSERYL